MTSPGHVFVVGADLTRLACDDVLVPSDAGRHESEGWLPLLPQDALQQCERGTCVGGRWPDGRRVVRVPGDGARAAWLVDTVGEEGRGLPWLLEGAREALDAVAGREVRAPVHGRARRLVGLPALGTGGGWHAASGAPCSGSCCRCCRTPRTGTGTTSRWCCREPSDLAAAQQVRRSRPDGWDLPDGLREVADRLGRQAREGGLAVFAGAGVSAAAGLPTWRRLLDELAERSRLEPALRDGLADLPPQDSAALLARELGQEQLAAYVQERFGARPYALAHALLAALPVHELVTTNYDPLLELAAAAAGRDLRVLPFEEPEPGRPWLLKLHGDAAHPESVVLTREQYLESGDHRAALSGVLAALLLTRHVLFVGSSMLDDDLIRIAHDVRAALPAGRRTGTVLSLLEDPARARLWQRDVETVPVAPAGTSASEAGRRLDVLLDLLGCLACPPAGYLLDPAYRGLLDDDERAVAESLRGLDELVTGAARSTWAWGEVDAVLQRLGRR